MQLSGAAQSSRTQPPLMLVPHALVAAYLGDTVAAVRACVAHTPDRTMLVVPVDYDNDSVATALAVARTQESRVWGVQLATSEHLVDQSIIPVMGGFVPTGVNPHLVWNVQERARRGGVRRHQDSRVGLDHGYAHSRVRG